MLMLCKGSPYFSMWIDLNRGAYEVDIADHSGFSMCIPFWDVGLEISSRT